MDSSTRKKYIEDVYYQITDIKSIMHVKLIGTSKPLIYREFKIRLDYENDGWYYNIIDTIRNYDFGDEGCGNNFTVEEALTEAQVSIDWILANPGDYYDDEELIEFCNEVI